MNKLCTTYMVLGDCVVMTRVISCYCTVWWRVAGKISCICPFDSGAGAACERRCSAVWPLCGGEGADHCQWWITVFSAFSSPPRTQRTPTWDRVQSQPSWWFYQVCWCRWLWCLPLTVRPRGSYRHPQHSRLSRRDFIHLLDILMKSGPRSTSRLCSVRAAQKVNFRVVLGVDGVHLNRVAQDDIYL